MAGAGGGSGGGGDGASGAAGIGTIGTTRPRVASRETGSSRLARSTPGLCLGASKPSALSAGTALSPCSALATRSRARSCADEGSAGSSCSLARAVRVAESARAKVDCTHCPSPGAASTS